MHEPISGPSPLEGALLKARCGETTIRHGFFTRRGGVSSGIYDSLNCGTGSNDQPDHISANRARVAGWFGGSEDRLVNVFQHHSADVITVDAPFAGDRPKADALVTATPGLILGILTADCGPVLFADPENGVVGAAHAGWRGAFSGVLEATIAAMVRLGARPSAITASLGPTISRAAYEVGPEFIDRFIHQDAGHQRFFTPSDTDGHAFFDLPAYIASRLQDTGVSFEISDRCTYGDEDHFFSYRRNTHRNQRDYGRQISAITL